LRHVRTRWDERPLPDRIARFLREADQRIEQAHAADELPEAFVAADYALVYQALAQIEPAPRRFLEWGCGFGVVTGLAASLGWTASGIERDGFLAEKAESLLNDFGLPATIEQGDFTHWPLEADLVFMYMWPAEIPACLEHFAKVAPPGSHLLSFDGGDHLTLFIKK